MGNNCFLNYNVSILDSCLVTIGNNVFIGPGVVITAVTHPNEASKRHELQPNKVVIEDDVWIGANCVIMPGATLHKGAIFGANSFVKNDVMENLVVGGIPAKTIKEVKQ